MEAVPRLPMLCFDLKSSVENPSFGPKLKQYIREFYNEDPDAYSSEIHNLEGIRAQAVCTVRNISGCQALKRYYCQLHFLQSRFPMAKNGAAAIPFTWQDTYTSVVCSLADIRFEMVCILYNIGALHSQLGASDSRVSADGMKMCCTHFQCAAWAFQHLKDTYPQPAGVDLAPNVMVFMYQLMLAQAQECILEKSMMDNRKATIIAKVAIQVVDYYNLSLNVLEQSESEECAVVETVGSKLYKNWKRYVKFKIVYHSALSLLYHGQQAEEQQKMGERVAFYQAASDKLKEAMKLSKGMDEAEAVNEALAFTMDVIEGKKKAAKNENEFIYHEEVPDREVLTEVKGASLVKGIPFSVNDSEISGPDIFARLVPMKAHEASSLYSEEKAKLRRRIGLMIDEKDQELVAFMTSLQLDQLNLHSESDALPQELVDRCAALSAKPNAIQDLIESMNKLADTYHDVEGMLQDIKELLEMEEDHEKEYQEMMGKRPPSIVATDLTREANKYQEAHAKASESNQTLHKAMLLHISNLRILAQPLEDLHKQIPTISILNSPKDESSVNEMQHLVGKVEEMKQQRTMLVDTLRVATSHDDITSQLVTRTAENLDSIFNQEMQKHQRIVATIEQNLTAQGNILKAVTEAYARYAGTRKATLEILRNRDSTINALISSYDAYEDLLAKSSKGLEFYRKLETNVTKLLQRVKGTCKVQDEEREQILAKNYKTVPSSKAATEQPDEPVVPSKSGPKLKDYLQSMKMSGGRVAPGGGAAASAYANPAPYYNTAYGQVPPAVSPLPPGYYDQSSSHMPNDGSHQWVPSVRPNPVGQEGSEPSSSTCYSSNTITEPKTESKITSQHGYPYPSVGGYSQSSYNSPSSYPPSYSNPNAAYSQGYPSVATTSYNYSTPDYSQQYQPVAQASGSSTTFNPSQSALNQSGQVYGTEQSATYQFQQGYPAANVNHPQSMAQSAQQVNYSAQSLQQTYTPQSIQQQQSYPTQTVQQPSYPGPQQQSPYPAQHSTYSTQQGIETVSLAPAQGYITQQGYPATSTPQPNTGTQYNPQPPASQQGTGHSQTDSYASHPGYSYNTATGQYQYASGYQSSTTGGYSAQQPYADQSVPASGQANAWSQQYPSQNSAYGQEFHSKPTDSNNSVSTGLSVGVSYGNQTPYYGNAQQQYSYNQAPLPPVTNPYETSQYQFNTNPADSRYTSAGNHSTNQTSSTQVSVDGQTFYAQYNASTGYEAPGAYAPGSYYSLPYGYQNDGSVATPPPSPRHAISPPATNVPQQSTYMSARGPYSMTSTTNSQPGASLTSSTSVDKINGSGGSNVDLLAGLDFTINQAPLAPQQLATTKKEEQKSVQALVVGKKSNGVDVQLKQENVMKSEPMVKQLEVVVPPSHSELPIKDEVNTSIKSENPSTDTVQEDGKLFSKGFDKDPYIDPESLNQFVQEVEKYEKFVDGLTTKTLNGPTPLDMKWKELLDLQEKDANKHSISVARCYPMKNRFPDILPYDNSRIELPSTKDDYINASYMKDMTALTPPFILTQAPLPSTYTDFWTMVWEQQVEVIVCLLSDTELQEQVYWPVEKGQEMAVGKMKLALQSSEVRPHWVERIISVTLVETRITRVIVHLQYTAWPGSSFPASPAPFLGFVAEALNYYNQQRGKSHPVVVHCLSGVGRTGLFCLITAALCEILAGSGLLELVQTTAHMSRYRKGSLRDREHLKFAYQAMLYYAQDMLMKRGILTSRSTFDDKRSRGGKGHTRHPSEDFLLGPPTDLSQLQSGIEKMGLVAANKTHNIPEKLLSECQDPTSQSKIVPPGGSICSSVSSSGRSSPIAHSLVDGFRTSLKQEQMSGKSRKRYTKESFKSSISSLDSASPLPDDPLSQLDPLWQLK